MFFASALVGLYSVLMVQKSAWTYYAYAFFPVVFWEEVYARRRSVVEGARQLVGHVGSWTGVLGLLVEGVAFGGVLEAMVGFSFRSPVRGEC